MKITQISLTNFRSFKDTQVIDLAPVTLIFGPNSAGKSSIFSALFYIQQILDKKQCDPMYIDALNKKYVGGFKNLVHKRDLDSVIKIKIKYELGTEPGRSYTYLYPLIEKDLDIKLESPVKKALSISTEFEIAWSKINNKAYVKSYTVEFDDSKIATIESEYGSKASITFLNYIHPLLLPANHEDWLAITEKKNDPVHAYNRLVIYGQDVKAEGEKEANEALMRWIDFDDLDNNDVSKTISLSINRDKESGHISINSDNESERIILLNALATLYDNVEKEEFNKYLTGEKPIKITVSKTQVHDGCYASKLHELIHSYDWDKDQYITVQDIHEYNFLHNPISVYDTEDALPPLGRKLFNSLDLDDVKKSEIVSELLSDVLVAPLDNLLAILKKSISIGPIRKIIDANYQPLPYIEQKDWFDGSAAWSYLEKADLDTLKKIHTWMSDENKLNLGYGIALKEVQSITKTFDINKADSKTNEDNKLEVKVHDESDFIDSKKGKTYRYSIIDKFNKIPVTPSEVGTGVSQLMPLIIAAVSQQGGIVACEQPELHLHPRIQVAIADLLTQNIDNVNYLVETHSEHLILRLLKRIRQHTDNELPEGLDFIKKNDVAIIYLEPTENGVIANKIGITEDGEFTDNWPHGFFSERRQELM
ncbi:AAA family ATPase [Psychrobacter ciconiae]|uniref:AAA family ATPase n=1 Tax=Psychrobacter ciconiae TaxID=1553449 RepID=UPI001919E321|nr:DUF3696 domain-containing protein [Psychrobacter ciconiae]